ncbi:unnamed protein product [Blepharisma stoltei]|uniref:SMP-LTD domain-containing protein n=1 Tax=Blepharisma stoltei TaxID=1481888 RepID=A0AAU9K0I9_9CILI|nr:unnamed protein product [Blepharisma stoltei]
MESKLKKIAPAVGAFSVFIYIYPEKLYTIFWFCGGVWFTILLQLAVYYLFLLKEPREKLEEPKTDRKINLRKDSAERIEMRREQHDATPRRSLKRRETMVPCLCKGSEFNSLASGSDSTITELVQYMKDLVQIEKAYGQALSKIGEISFLTKVISKQNKSQLFGNLKVTLNQIGINHTDEAKYLSDSLIEHLLVVEKEMKSKHKELAQKLKNFYGNVEAAANDLQKVQTKLTETQNAQQKAQNEYKDIKNIGFEVIAKREMKLKLISSELSTLQHTLQQMKDKLNEEIYKYLPKAKEVFEEFKVLRHQKASQYISCVKSWINSLESCMSNNLQVWHKNNDESMYTEGDEILDIDEEVKANESSLNWNKRQRSLEMKEEKFGIKDIKDIWAKAVNRITAVNQQEIEDLDKKAKEVKNYFEDITAFIKNLISAERNYASELNLIIEAWHNLDELGIGDEWRSTAKDFEFVTEAIERHSEEVEGVREELNNFEVYLSDFYELLDKAKGTPELLQKVKEKLSELIILKDRLDETCKAKLTIALGNKLKECHKFLSSLHHMDDAEDIEVFGQFSDKAKNHREQCPYFIQEIVPESGSENTTVTRIQTGSAESSVWLNELLSTYISEWIDAPRFQKWICRRLKKVYNKDRPEIISEINVRNVELGGQSPIVSEFTPLSKDSELDFYYEFDLVFEGQVIINIDFQVLLGPAKIPIYVRIILHSFNGRVMLFYTPSDKGMSWYSLTAKPDLRITLEPVLGKANKVELKKFPQLIAFLMKGVDKKLEKFIFPNTRSIKIPKGKKPIFRL